MSLFGLFKKPNDSLSVTIRSPEYFETTSVNLPIQVFLSSKLPQKVVRTSARLRADATKRNRKADTPSRQSLGEANDEREIIIDPAKPSEIGFDIPVDFSVIDSFEIPPENLSVASKEMQNAAVANRTLNYHYNIEVTTKSDDGHEQIFTQPIRLVQPDEVRAG